MSPEKWNPDYWGLDKGGSAKQGSTVQLTYFLFSCWCFSVMWSYVFQMNNILLHACRLSEFVWKNTLVSVITWQWLTKKKMLNKGTVTKFPLVTSIFKVHAEFELLHTNALLSNISMLILHTVL